MPETKDSAPHIEETSATTNETDLPEDPSAAQTPTTTDQVPSTAQETPPKPKTARKEPHELGATRAIQAPRPVMAGVAVIDLTDNLPGYAEADAAVEQVVGKPLSDTKFDTFDLPKEITQAIEDLGFEHCTPIQALSLPHTLKGRDLTGQAQTGTGKTAAFLITMFKEFLETERTHPTAPRAVVVAPTRELALQIADDAQALSYYTDVNTVAVFGGMDWQKQARQLEDTVDLVVGTPGRMMDYMKRGLLDLRHVQTLVIDEADRMFDMGFINDIRFILSRCNTTRQTMLFSATFPFEVVRLAQSFLHDPIDVKIAPDHITAATIEQVLYHVAEFEKLQFLLWLLEEEKPRKALIFLNTKRAGEWLGFKLFHNGWDAEYISGDVPQKKRMRIIDDFKEGRLEVMVATDVAGRGLHVDDIDLVVNFDLPTDAADYVHRIGRTGRAGHKGKAVSLADERLVQHLVEIERFIGRRIRAVVPDDDNFLRDQSPSYRASRVNKRRDGRSGGGSGSGGGRGRGGRSGRRDGHARSQRSSDQNEGHDKPTTPTNESHAQPEGAPEAPKRKRRRRRRKSSANGAEANAPQASAQGTAQSSNNTSGSESGE